MARRTILAATLGLLVLSATARAQFPRPSRYGPAMSLDGPVYNPTMMPEYYQAGGNMEMFQQLMMQKMAAQQQAAFQQQMQAYQKWAKANPQQAAALEKQQMEAYRAANRPYVAPARKKGKKPTTSNLKASRGSSTAKAAAKTADDKAADAATEEAAAPAATPTTPAATAKPATAPAATKPAAPK